MSRCVAMGDLISGVDGILYGSEGYRIVNEWLSFSTSVEETKKWFYDDSEITAL